MEVTYAALQKRLAKLEYLVQCLIDEDPNDMAADGVTVLDVWRKEARYALIEKPIMSSMSTKPMENINEQQD